MPLLWEFDQGRELVDFPYDVHRGICMAMSYYVSKRMLAGITTTPEVLRRKMPLFASMQRASQKNGKLTSVEWVKMLALGDNLKADIGDYSDSFMEAMTKGFANSGEARGDVGAIYLSFKWESTGHGIILGATRSGTMSLFDPNVGLIDVKNDNDFKICFREYPEPGLVGIVVLQGAPRDLKALGTD
jgi:hypothetical protein